MSVNISFNKYRLNNSKGQQHSVGPNSLLSSGSGFHLVAVLPNGRFTAGVFATSVIYSSASTGAPLQNRFLLEKVAGVRPSTVTGLTV